MIKGNKKWSVYGMLPKEVNKVYIYAPALYDPIYEKELKDIRDYLINRVDTIGKVVRLTEEESMWCDMPFEGIFIMYNERGLPRPYITNLIAKLKEPELEPPIIELIKLLKDGEDLL